MSYLSLECSRRIQELLPDLKTEKTWITNRFGEPGEPILFGGNPRNSQGGWTVTPAPSFAETIRLLPALGEVLGIVYMLGHANITNAQTWAFDNGKELLRRYMLAPSPDQGMEDVSAYILKLLSEGK